MSDNVIILGAGASADAGIPLLGNFIEKMIELAATGRGSRGKLNDIEKSILEKAIKIRNSIENYHARVAIDQFNIEQLLSVLLFNSQSGGRNNKINLEIFKQAIAATIDLTCKITNDEDSEHHNISDSIVYTKFWTGFLSKYRFEKNNIPTIISFNYDLVLERSLINFFKSINNHQIISLMKIDGFKIDYGNPKITSPVYLIKERNYTNFVGPKKGFCVEELRNIDNKQSLRILEIRILKLHGSLNFPQNVGDKILSLTKSLSTPNIIPPVFNKSDITFSSPIWRKALKSLANCRNLVICGYSLPTTDTYMQYFLKAALGPNQNFSKVTVFDPELHKDGVKGTDLIQRYSECFSAQFKDRINFKPTSTSELKSRSGEFSHMVQILNDSAKDILFQ
jgi:hypothetical protein